MNNDVTTLQAEFSVSSDFSSHYIPDDGLLACMGKTYVIMQLFLYDNLQILV